jgi:hypothetical protein
MTIRSITQYLQRWKRRPRFGTPGLGLALVFFLAAALLMLLTRGSTEPASRAQPVPPPSIPSVKETAPVQVPPVVPPEENVPVPAAPASVEAESRCPQGCEVPPPGCFIKGNVSPKTGERIYHLPGQQFYGRTDITPGKDEAWFCTEEEARANGWRKSKV